MFTVYGPHSDETDVDSKGSMHSYLLLTRSDTTMVLKTDQEINEMEQSGFNVTSATILAANLDCNRLVVQVCPGSVHLLNATTGAMLHQLTMPEDFPIKSASALDPYVTLLSQNGQIGMITLAPGPLLVFTPMKLENSDAVCLCLYRDVGGVFTTTPSHIEASTSIHPSSNKIPTIKK